MDYKLSGEKKEYLLRFIAALSWADGEVKQEEIAHVMKIARKHKVSDALKTDLQHILSVHHTTSDIVDAYQELQRCFSGSRNFPTMIDEKGKSTYVSPEDVDSLITSAVFHLFASDGSISTEEGEVLAAISSTGTDVRRAKNIVFGFFDHGQQNTDQLDIS